jgi:hypothetical protein
VIMQDRRSTTEVKMPLVAALERALGSGGVGGFQGDLMAHALQLADQAVAVGCAGLPRSRAGSSITFASGL